MRKKLLKLYCYYNWQFSQRKSLTINQVKNCKIVDQSFYYIQVYSTIYFHYLYLFFGNGMHGIIMSAMPHIIHITNDN